MNKIFKKPLLIIILLVTFLVLGSFYIFRGTEEGNDNSLSSDEVTEKVINYINENLSSTPVTFISVEEESGLYKMKIEIGGQESDLYASKDGNILFPSFISTVPPELKEIVKTEVPDVHLFVMSFCPYGNLAEGIMDPVEELLKDKLDIKLNYIIYSDYASGYPVYCLDEESTYCSMHGIQEINQNIREICVQKYQPEKLWDFVMNINENTSSENVDEKWEEIASSFDIDTSKIKECQQNEGVNILVEELKLTGAKYLVQDPSNHQGNEEISISGSPTLVINGIIYDGDRSSEGYKDAICSAFLNPPSECEEEVEGSKTGVEGGC